MPGLPAIFVAGLSTIVLLPMLAFAGLTGTGSNCTPSPDASATTATTGGDPTASPGIGSPTSGNGPATVAPVVGAQWDADQFANAATIVTVGQAKSVPPWGWVIAVATAIQESRLRNLPGGDADSIGLFQQRPSQGWGSPEQLASPAYQAGKFYDALLAVRHWQSIPLTVAAQDVQDVQDVQRSAYPNAYAPWTDDAIHLITLTTGQAIDPTNPGSLAGGTSCSLDDGDGLPTAAAVALPTGFVLPPGTSSAAVAAITWALTQLGTPYSYGGDCTAPHSGDPTRECDCSSLVQQAYRAAGVTLPRTTSEQVHAGVAVTSANLLQPGDLVFIPGSHGTPAAPSHVGLYIGDGLIIHAPHTGDTVKVSTVESWSPMSTIRRIVYPVNQPPPLRGLY